MKGLIAYTYITQRLGGKADKATDFCHLECALAHMELMFSYLSGSSRTEHVDYVGTSADNSYALE